MTRKMRLKMKNGSDRSDISRPRPRHGHKYTKYKMCLSIMMAIGMYQATPKQHFIMNNS